MVRTTIFQSNRSQAVRLPKDVAFPNHVKQVAVLRDGKRRVIVPAEFSGTSSSTRRVLTWGRVTNRRNRRAKVSNAAILVGHESLHPRPAGSPSDVARTLQRQCRKPVHLDHRVDGIAARCCEIRTARPQQARGRTICGAIGRVAIRCRRRRSRCRHTRWSRTKWPSHRQLRCADRGPRTQPRIDRRDGQSRRVQPRRGTAMRGLASLASQYGSRTKINVVPVTIGALAPTNDTLASFTCRDPARPEACNAPSIMCHSP